VIDVVTGERLIGGLSMPHSPGCTAAGCGCSIPARGNSGSSIQRCRASNPSPSAPATPAA